MEKFGRNYVLTITPPLSVVGETTIPGTTLIISLPFTIEFDVIQNTLSSANMCRIRIYNLGEKNRNLIRYNQNNYGVYFGIQLQAGYGTNLLNLPTIFKGNVSQAFSVREGNNFITQIECYDGGFAYVNGSIDLTVNAGEPRSLTLTRMIEGGLPNVTLGAVGNYTETALRDSAISGNTADKINELSGGGFFISNEKAYVLGTNEYTSASLVTISSDSGLLNTPAVEQTKVRFEMIFEPALKVGQLVLLNSLTAPFLNSNVNGQYKIIGVKHRAMISSAVCGEAVTEGEFFFLRAPTPAGVFGAI